MKEEKINIAIVPIQLLCCLCLQWTRHRSLWSVNK